MSYVAERGWQIEARRRREIYLERVRNVTAAHAARNRERLDALSKQGLDIYISEDYRNCRVSMERVKRFLSQDPEQREREHPPVRHDALIGRASP